MQFPLDLLKDEELVWFHDREIGYCPSANFRSKYDDGYHENYEERTTHALAKQLVQARIDLIDDFVGDRQLVDFGCGSGQFLRERNELYGRTCTRGYDLMTRSIAWLLKNDLYCNPWTCETGCLSFWDSLEHVEDPAATLKRAGEWVFVSMPIFFGVDHVRASKHFKPGEHLWYFTKEGLIGYFEHHGFSCQHSDDRETQIGREDIMSFAFKRGY